MRSWRPCSRRGARAGARGPRTSAAAWGTDGWCRARGRRHGSVVTLSKGGVRTLARIHTPRDRADAAHGSRNGRGGARDRRAARDQDLSAERSHGSAALRRGPAAVAVPHSTRAARARGSWLASAIGYDALVRGDPIGWVTIVATAVLAAHRGDLRVHALGAIHAEVRRFAARGVGRDHRRHRRRDRGRAGADHWIGDRRVRRIVRWRARGRVHAARGDGRDGDTGRDGRADRPRGGGGDEDRDRRRDRGVARGGGG